MKKSVTFARTRFLPSDIEETAAVFNTLLLAELAKLWTVKGVSAEEQAKLLASTPALRYDTLTISAGKTQWTHDSVEEFLADFSQSHDYANIDFRSAHLTFEVGVTVDVYHYPDHAEVQVKHPTRAGVERIMQAFERLAVDRVKAPLPPAPPEPEPRPRIFIGHGGASTQWRDLKDHLRDQHGYDVVAYETGARAGHTIRDILDEMLEESTFAVLVMTAEDEQGDGRMRARQNVVHETGLFQGRLGFSRAVILLEEGVENLSNLDGVQYIGFRKGSIRETYGDVLATLTREFGSPG